MADFSERNARCERARLWAALEVDGELSELERKLLLAHTQRCSACARSLEQFHGIAAIVRAAEPEARRRTFVFPERAPRPGLHLGVPRLAAVVVALLVMAAGLGVLAGSSLTGSQGSSKPASIDVALLTKNDVREFRDMRRLDLQPPRERLAPPGRLAAV